MPECHSVAEINQKLVDKSYEIIKLVGSGAMTCVYLARERQDGHLYAFKILRDNYRHSDKHRMIFRNEAEIMQQFQHPNIVRFYKYVEEATYAYIRMDYIDGVSLHSILRETQAQGYYLPLDDVIRILRQVAQGLNYLHREEQLHLDVKPANILIQAQDGRVFVTDLGLTMDSGGTRTYVAGTPYYMPCEQQGNMAVSTTTDTYALAIMAYEMLVLRRPFEMETKDASGREALKNAHCQMPVPPITSFREELPQALNAVFDKALAKNPQQRYETYALVEAIHEVLKPLLSPELQSLADVKPAPLHFASVIAEAGVPQATSSFNWFGRIAGLVILAGIIAIALYVFMQNNNSSPVVTATAIVVAPITEVTDEATAVPTTQAPTATPTAASSENDGIVSAVASVTIASTASATQTPSPTATFTATASPTASSTSTATYTATPTATVTATHTPTPLPTALPTAFLSNEPILFLAEGLEMIGIGASLNEALTIFQRENQTIIPLRSGSTNSFYLVLEFENPQGYEEYGVVYHYQSPADYWLFRIVSVRREWQLVEVRDGTESIQESGVMEILASRLVVAGLDEYFRYEMDSQFVQFQRAEIPNGTVGLWLKNASAGASIRQIQYGLLGDNARAASENRPTLAAPAISISSFLLQNLQALQATANFQGQVNCTDFITIYDGLERHLNRPEVADQTRNIIAVSSFIYNRCRSQGLNQTIDLTDAYVDFLNWQSEMQALMDILIVQN
jgi:serine/threonine protein kinase